MAYTTHPDTATDARSCPSEAGHSWKYKVKKNGDAAVNFLEANHGLGVNCLQQGE